MIELGSDAEGDREHFKTVDSVAGCPLGDPGSDVEMEATDHLVMRPPTLDRLLNADR